MGGTPPHVENSAKIVNLIFEPFPNHFSACRHLRVLKQGIPTKASLKKIPKSCHKPVSLKSERNNMFSMQNITKN